MIAITEAQEDEIPLISQLANEIWWPTYQNILLAKQIEFMLQDNYSEAALKQQMLNGDTFLMLKSHQEPKGFASFSKTEKPNEFKIHKLYIHPDQQGKGLGKLFLEVIEEKVKELGAKFLLLNVNRGNQAKLFYEKMGFEVIQEIDIPYFEYILNDYIMQKDLMF